MPFVDSMIPMGIQFVVFKFVLASNW